MIYNFFGKNDFLKNLFLQEEIKKYAKNNFEVFSYNFKDDNINSEKTKEILLNFNNTIKAIGLFNNKKIIIAKNFNEKNLNKTELKNLLESFKTAAKSKDIFIILTTNQKITIIKSIINDFKEFEDIDAKKIDDFINKTSNNHNVKITKNGRSLLKTLFKNDLASIYFEIQKLSNYKPEIDEKDILSLINPTSNSINFAINNALNTLNKKTCCQMMFNEINANTHELLIFGSVISYIKNALLLKEKYQGKKSLFKIHPFVEKNMRSFVNNFSNKDLIKIYSQLFQYDLLIKKGKISTELALELFFVKNLK